MDAFRGRHVLIDSAFIFCPIHCLKILTTFEFQQVANYKRYMVGALCWHWTLHTCNGFRGHRWKRARRGSTNILLNDLILSWLFVHFMAYCLDYVSSILNICFHDFTYFLSELLDHVYVVISVLHLHFKLLCICEIMPFVSVCPIWSQNLWEVFLLLWTLFLYGFAYSPGSLNNMIQDPVGWPIDLYHTFYLW